MHLYETVTHHRRLGSSSEELRLPSTDYFTDLKFSHRYPTLNHLKCSIIPSLFHWNQHCVCVWPWSGNDSVTELNISWVHSFSNLLPFNRASSISAGLLNLTGKWPFKNLHVPTRNKSLMMNCPSVSPPYTVYLCQDCLKSPLIQHSARSGRVRKKLHYSDFMQYSEVD